MIADLILLLALTVPVVLLFRRLRMPSIAGILAVGAIAGPNGLAWVGRTEEVETLAEVGVTLLLFIIGLEFSLPRFFEQGRQLVSAGGLQMVGTICAGWLVAVLLGLPSRDALLLGMLIAPSSTAFVMTVFSDTRQIDAPHGTLVVGILLFQDLCVIPLMLALPLLANSGAGVSSGVGSGGIAIVLLKAAGALAAIILIARYVFPRAARVVMRVGGRELFTIFVVLAALAAAWATARIGLSLALGAFVAGLFIAESEYSHQVVSEIRPFRDVCNALFFIAIGMLFDPSVITARPLPVLGFVALLVAGKALVMFPIGMGMTKSAGVSLLASLSLAQVGEFSFVLLTQAESLGIVDPTRVSVFLNVAILSMFASPFLIQLAPFVASRLRPKQGSGGPSPPEAKRRVEVVVLGYGLNGENVARVLQQSGIAFQVVELNVARVSLARQRGVPALFGDGSRVDVLERAGLRDASILVIAIADPAATRRAIAVSRHVHPGVFTIVRTRYMSELAELVALGADEVIPEEFETSVAIFSRVLKRLGVPRGNIAVQVELVRREGYQLMVGQADPLHSLEMLREILAETTVETIRVPHDSPLIGRTLGEIDLRAKTGAAVISAVSDGEVVHAPGGDFTIRQNSVLVITGAHEQIERCREAILGGGGA